MFGRQKIIYIREREIQREEAQKEQERAKQKETEREISKVEDRKSTRLNSSHL